MNIVFFEVKPWEKEYLEKAFPDAIFLSDKVNEENCLTYDVKQAEVISVFVDSKVDTHVLEKMPHLKMITVRATGFDNVDVVACKEKRITVCNVPFYGENTVAEHAFGLLLDLSRKIHQSIARVKEEGFNFEGLTGFDLKGKTIGIVGLGHIGQHVSRIAKGFEMKILTCDPKHGNTTLEELLKGSDIITLHVPHNEHTHHLINKNNIHSIKKGAYLINTARGGIVETAALVEALEEGILAGAGLDVLEEEAALKEEAHLMAQGAGGDFKTLLEDHVLMEMENVIITPHNAFNSKEALDRIMEATVENIQAFAKGKTINYV